ncbi:Crp/Fnr family transcriptional regulator [Saccharopolyspora tripterygii]
MQHHNGAVPRGFRALLGESRWGTLEQRGGLRRYEPGDHLLRQGEEGGFLVALVSGRVKVLAGDRQGSAVLLSLRGPGDLVGEMAAERNTARTATVQALDVCVGRVVMRSEFERFLDERDARGAYADYLVAKLSETVPYQVQQAHFGPRRRLARLFLEVVRHSDANPPACYRIPFSQEALASALGLVRSTVAEQIKAMRADGVLGPGPRIAVADMRGLIEDAGAIQVE